MGSRQEGRSGVAGDAANSTPVGRGWHLGGARARALLRVLSPPGNLLGRGRREGSAAAVNLLDQDPGSEVCLAQ